MTEVVLGVKKRKYRALVHTGIDVHTAALARIRWLWEEFDGNLSVSVSGGKDSTVVMELAAIVAREHDSQLKVQFLDQEAEWQGTRDYLRKVADREDISFEWYQIPFRLFNAASHMDDFGFMWPTEPPMEGYMRPPEVDSIRDNDFGVDRFTDVLKAMNTKHGGVHLSGMRAEEAPTRRLGMTTKPAYKWATWGAGSPEPGSAPFWLMHPLYDWSYRDIWKAIEEHGWEYNSVYDGLYRYGVSHRDMRVSSLIHSGAVRHIDQIQEIEPETWENLVRRYAGTNAAAHIGEDGLQQARLHLPYMFNTWLEYANYLIDNLIAEDNRPKFRHQIEIAKRSLPWMTYDRIAQKLLPSIMKNDYFNDYSFAKWLQASRTYAEQYEQQHGRPLKPDSAPPLNW